MKKKKQAVRHRSRFFKKERVGDTIILGCTHFVHLAEVIQHEAGDGVRVVDSRERCRSPGAQS